MAASTLRLPEHLYHYYERGGAPLRSISELSADSFDDLMLRFADTGVPENRFDTVEKRNFYRFFRLHTEAQIRTSFIAKGGKPVLQHPRYLTLGPTTWFDGWYKDCASISVPLSAIDQSVISFTYPDSMTSYLIAEDRYEPFAQYKRAHHGLVFTLAEIQTLVQQIGLPDEDDLDNRAHGNRIVEAQIWDLAPLAAHL